MSDDPEKTFAEAAAHVIYRVNNYSEWLQAGGLQPLAPHLNDHEDLRKSGLFEVVDPDAAIRGLHLGDALERYGESVDRPSPIEGPIPL